MNEDEVMGGEPLDHIIDHLLPAEEDRPFVLLKRAQAGIGIFRPGGRQKVRG